MPRIFTACIVIVVAVGMQDCQKIKRWLKSSSEPEMNACDPFSDFYDASGHYIDRDFLTPDGTIDYKKLLDAAKKDASPCDPLKKKKEQGLAIPEVQAEGK